MGFTTSPYLSPVRLCPVYLPQAAFAVCRSFSSQLQLLTLAVFLLSTLVVPGSWPQAAAALAAAMYGDGSAVLNAVTPHAGDLARSAVSCNDNAPFKAPEPEVVVNELLGVFHNVSRLGFTVVTTEPDMGCQYWPVTPPERFQGPWNHTLRNPMLVLSNAVCCHKSSSRIVVLIVLQADPVTPLSSGKLVSQLLGNSSRLMIQNSPGVSNITLHATTISY